MLAPAKQKPDVHVRAFLMLEYRGYRGVAQLVARTAGGREVAGSSPVTPTTKKVQAVSVWAFLVSVRYAWFCISGY